MVRRSYQEQLSRNSLRVSLRLRWVFTPAIVEQSAFHRTRSEFGAQVATKQMKQLTHVRVAAGLHRKRELLRASHFFRRAEQLNVRDRGLDSPGDFTTEFVTGGLFQTTIRLNQVLHGEIASLLVPISPHIQRNVSQAPMKPPTAEKSSGRQQ